MKKMAIVTGGSRGIGLGIAQQLASGGFDLLLNGRRPETEVEETIRLLRSGDNKIIYCQGDISSAADRKKILEQAKEQFGTIHLLVNNAGMAPRMRLDILEATEESFDEVISVNLKGPYFLTQAVANRMIELKKVNKEYRPCIINISSISATVASVNRGDYCISKAGISMSTMLYAARLGEFDIPVYEIRPGIIHSDMTAGVREKYDKLIEEGLTVQKRWGEPEDVGKVVASIANGNFSYSTGQVFMVDGGMTLSRL